MRPRLPFLAALLAAGLGSGCGAQLSTADLSANLASSATGALAAIPKAAAQLSEGIKQPVGTATEVYTRVARGALTCWLGAHGPLKGTHLFQAEAQSAHKGGRSEIAIHERVADAPNQPGKRVFAILIEPHGERAVVEASNLHLPAPQGDSMSRDVQRWAANDEGCLPDGVMAGWDAQAAASVGELPKGQTTKAKASHNSAAPAKIPAALIKAADTPAR